jgi:YihY family inner membrane protein
MSSAGRVPETWELSGDDAWDTLSTTGRVRLVRDAFSRFRAADGTSHARSLAFLSTLIIIQGVVVVLGLAGAVVQGSLSSLIVHTLQSAAPGPAGKLLTEAVVQAHQAGASHRYTALVVGLVAVLVSGTMLMGQLERGLNRVYGVERDRSTVRKYARAFVLTLSAGSMIAVAFITLAIGRSIADSLGGSTSVRIWDVIRWPLGFVLAIAAIALMFRSSPARRQPTWSWLAFGSFVAVALWTLATVGLGFFFRFSSTFGQTYGPLAGIIALCLWAFLVSVGLLLGGAIAAQLEAVRAGAPVRREPVVERAPMASPSVR